jgi:hypothetical protein
MYAERKCIDSYVAGTRACSRIDVLMHTHELVGTSLVGLTMHLHMLVTITLILHTICLGHQTYSGCADGKGLRFRCGAVECQQTPRLVKQDLLWRTSGSLCPDDAYMSKIDRRPACTVTLEARQRTHQGRCAPLSCHVTAPLKLICSGSQALFVHVP